MFRELLCVLTCYVMSSATGYIDNIGADRLVRTRSRTIRPHSMHTQSHQMQFCITSYVDFRFQINTTAPVIYVSAAAL